MRKPKSSNETREITDIKSDIITSVDKAFKILDCFGPEQTTLSLSQISKQLSIPKSTLFKQLRTLEQGKYLLKDAQTQTYRLGYKIMQLNYCLRVSMPLLTYSIPVMEKLQTATGEIIYLTSCIDGKVFYLECIYPSHRSISYSVSGRTLPMHCTGCGKAMLSYMSNTDIEYIIAKHGLFASTPNTITNIEDLMQELALCKARGYALDNEEETLGVRCVAMPILASDGKVAGSLSISGSKFSICDDNIPNYVKLLSNATNSLARYASLFPNVEISLENHNHDIKV